MEDEDVSDNWEDAADSGVVEREMSLELLHHFKVDLDSSNKKLANGDWRDGWRAKLKINQKSNSQSLPVKTAVVIQDDSLPAAPPPQIRILKRPPSNGSLGPQVASRPAQQVKSLAQREAEYAEARRRILGSAEEPSQERPDTERSAPAGAPSVSECLRPNNHIIRQPLGPDGTTGFRLSR